MATYDLHKSFGPERANRPPPNFINTEAFLGKHTWNLTPHHRYLRPFWNKQIPTEQNKPCTACESMTRSPTVGSLTKGKGASRFSKCQSFVRSESFRMSRSKKLESSKINGSRCSYFQHFKNKNVEVIERSEVRM